MQEGGGLKQSISAMFLPTRDNHSLATCMLKGSLQLKNKESQKKAEITFN